MFLALKGILLAKEESVYGSDPTPTVSANAIEASKVKVSPKVDMLERDYVRSNLSQVASIAGKRWAEITFSMELKGSGTAGTAGRIGDLFEACGFNETISAGSSVVYTPASTTMKSITLYYYALQDSGSVRLTKITGAVGTAKINCEAGKQATVDFSFKGIYNAPADAADPGAPTFETTKPPIVESGSFTLNGVTTLVAQKVEIDTANDIQPRDDISSANGIKGFAIVGRKAAGTMNPEAVTVAAYGFWADWVAASARAMSMIVGSVAGNKITISAPKVVIDSVEDEERNSILVQNVPFKCTGNAGNDELQLKFE